MTAESDEGTNGIMEPAYNPVSSPQSNGHGIRRWNERYNGMADWGVYYMVAVYPVSPYGVLMRNQSNERAV